MEFDALDNVFSGRIIGINDIVGFHADNVSDLKRAFEEAVDDYVDACRETGKNPDKPYSGKVMFRVPPEVHAKAALAAELSGKSLNQWAEETLREAADRGVAS